MQLNAENVPSSMSELGQTTSELQIRISGHRAWMEKKKDEKEDPGKFERKDEGALAEHLKQCKNEWKRFQQRLPVHYNCQESQQL